MPKQPLLFSVNVIKDTVEPFKCFQRAHVMLWLKAPGPFPKPLRYHFNGLRGIGKYSEQNVIRFQWPPLTHDAKFLQAAFFRYTSLTLTRVDT